LNRRYRNEKDISTKQYQTQKNAWIPGSFQDTQWKGCTAPSPGQRSQTAVSLIFPRGFKITSRSEYQICYSRGRRFLARNFIVFVLPTVGQHWRLGIAASKKIGNAVRRNRIKRLVREVFRVNQQEIGLEADIVVVVKRAAPISELNYHLVRNELLPLLDRINTRIGRDGFDK